MELQVIIQTAKLQGPPGSVTRNTRDKPANPRPFLFMPFQIEKKKEFINCLEFQKRRTSLSIFHLRPASGGSPRQPQWADTKHMPAQGLLSCQLSPLGTARDPHPQNPQELHFVFLFLFLHCYLHVLCVRPWTGIVIAYISLASERKSLSCRPVTWS